MNTRIKLRLKALGAIIISVALTGFGIYRVHDFMDGYHAVGGNPIITVYGMLNNVSNFVWVGICFPLGLFGLFTLITACQLSRLILPSMGVLAAIGFVIGFVYHTKLTHKVEEYGYIECTRLHHIALRESHRVYVLPPTTCKEAAKH
ncbi:hypothetical protein VR7878_03313 [Vibrio ruber DSM 16370]|uniref:Uncharacterized protein n=1 Tax=Vibrio ruber (strain DSM 16370 / JCM 11486 / BCRC 17186 / CECT 7878 / LMG 23124 / VR1) TaxID=1123498 RepID=A0A1R4LRL4_VIBR1|nr:hypothetical protein [Vibrio ruber]SJN59251.1 hypothetical protein VR7878_03313 [Vibrio ruber DSM 16370]